MANSIISYTEKDYASILRSLTEAIPQLTDKWKNYAEDDPGIVLLKLISAFGDMICYNMDYQVRETFPQTATQRKNAASMYSLIGYKMHWYQSAICNVSVKFTRPLTDDTQIPTSTPLVLTIPRFSQLMSEDLTPYVVVGSDTDRTLVLPALAEGQLEGNSYVTATMLAAQGVAYTQSEIYPSNITSDGRIYFSNTTVDEDPENNVNRPHMMLILCEAGTGVEIENWVKVSNLLNTREEGKYYEFKVDDKDAPYIQLCENYKNYLPLTDTKYFKLIYIISDGAEGNVSSNVNFSFQSIINIVYNGANKNVSSYVEITGNTQSDSGSGPETVDNARVGAAREAQVLNTAVTLFDYETLAESVDAVRACLAQDLTSAPTVVNSITVDVADCIDTTRLEYTLITGAALTTTRLKPGTLTMSVMDGATLLESYNDNSSNKIADSGSSIIAGSYVLYNNGAISLDLSGLATLADATQVVFDYTTEMTPYAIKLNVIMNDYGYITDITRTSLTSLLDNRKVVNVQYVINEALQTCIPYNIIIHSTEPYTSSTSLLPYLKEVVYNTLYDFYDSGDRTFGERINYAYIVNALQAADNKIDVADVLYPERSLKVADTRFPRLGALAVSLSDDPNTVFLQDLAFSDANYATLVSTLIGNAGFDVVCATNADKDNIINDISLQTVVYLNATTGAVDLGGVAHTVEWWCSRPDLIITEGINIGNLQTDNISMDTPVTLFCKVYSGNSSMVIPVSVDLTLKV